jgi:hypothetical protein
MSVQLSHTISRRLVARMVIAAALTLVALVCVNSHASAQAATPRTVLNFCSNRAGLGRVSYGRYKGEGYIAWDTNYDGVTDALAIDTNRDNRVNLAIIDTNEDGKPDLVGLCNGRPQSWYSFSWLMARLRQLHAQGEQPYPGQQPLGQRPNPASNAAWGEMMPGLAVLYGINPIGPDTYVFN